MYINSDIFSTPIWQLDSQGRKQTLINSQEETFNTNKLLGKDTSDLSVRPQNRDEPLSAYDKSRIKVADEDFSKLKLTKLFGPSFKNGIQWDEIERSLESSQTDKRVGYVSVEDGSQKAVETFGSIDFIDNFVITESSIREKFSKVFSGSELEENLNKFGEMATGVKDKLIDKFSNEFAQFFNLLPKNSDNNSSINGGQDFDIDKFKDNLKNIFSQKTKDLQDIIKSNSSEWNAFTSFASKKFNFAQALQSKNSGKTDSNISAIENMSYESIDVVYKTMREVKESMNVSFLSTNEVFGAHVGIAKLKVDLVLQNSNLSDFLKGKLSAVVDGTINAGLNDLLNKRTQFVIDIRKNNGLDYKVSDFDSKSINNTSALFSHLLDSGEKFASNYRSVLDQIGEQYYENSFEYTNLPGYINPKRDDAVIKTQKEIALVQRKNAFKDITEGLSQDWNRFVEKTDVDRKAALYVSTDNYSSIDVRI